MALAGLLGFDRSAYMAERDPAGQAINAALIDAAERLRSEHVEEQAERTISALARRVK